MRWLIVGGDMRSQALARIAADNGDSVDIMGLPYVTGTRTVSDVEGERYDAVVLPLPIAERNGRIPTPLLTDGKDGKGGSDITPALIAPTLTGNVWGGTPDVTLTKTVGERGGRLINPNDMESYAIANAYLTAEGAIVSALARYPGALKGTDVLIVGYGRIARCLARLLTAWNANVTVCARHQDARTWAEAEGCRAVSIGALATEAERCSILFQTAPVMLVDAYVIAGMKPGALVSDLTREGVDFTAAEERGLIAWRDSGVPGRYSPEAAGGILYDLIKKESEK
ncbi:dipicolinate synthase subunit A [Clostridia bacterium]|nr:dipicolinate synthase subunit A [Clostridia bacterium]